MSTILQNKFLEDGQGVKYAPITTPGAVRWPNGDDLYAKLNEKASASTTVNGHALTDNVTVTKNDVGLGNVGNFKAVSTVANQELSSTEKSNARANIGAGTSSFSGNYNDLTNKPDIPTKVSQLTNDSGFTSNTGTITGITMNGSSKGTSGVVDLGTVITQETKSDWNETDTSKAAYIQNKPDNKQAASGGTDVSLCTTGEKYTWNNKQSAVAKLGSTTKPVYTSAAGTFAECSTYAGGTAVTLNGSSKGGSTASFYAPTSYGTSGYYLKANGSGSAPTWAQFPTIPSISLNGSSATSPSFYAPTSAGTSGYYLKSNGSGAPSWASFPTIPSISLNGSSTTSPSFYAPTTAGTSGYYLKSNGSGAPTWTAFPTSMPASDVSAWAKAANKPSYAYSEISYAVNAPSATSGAVTVNFNTAPIHVITLNGNASSVTVSNLTEGHCCHVIFVSSSSYYTRTVAIAFNATSSITPNGEAMSLTVPKSGSGYTEVDFIMVNSKVYVRGV